MTDTPATSAAQIKHLLTSSQTGTLATLDAQKGGPYASLVAYALDPELRPLILISSLARHTQNLCANPRACLFVHGAPAEPPDEMTAPRATFLGRFERVPDADRIAARDAMLARHPASATYVDFADFGLWRLLIDEVHLVAGFGRVVTFPWAKVLGRL